MLFENDNTVGINDFSRSVEQYYSNLENKRHKPLSKEEERVLVIKAQNGDINARNKVIESNLRFVFNVAKKYRGRGVEIADLISVGNEGLIESLENFDLNRKVKFISYAVWKVRQNMSLLIKNRQNRWEKENSIDTLNGLPIPYVSDEENEECDDNNKWDISDADTNYIKLEETEEKKKVVNKLLFNLDDREKTIIKMFYGINEKEQPYTLEEISKQLSISTERVRQLKVKAIRDMRCNVFDVEDANFLFGK
jgi:RNA polymerase primary sigma factor